LTKHGELAGTFDFGGVTARNAL